MNPKKRILAADRPEGIQTLHNILGDSVDIRSAMTFAQALQELRSPVDLLICGVHFDDSRMFDLLSHVHAHPSLVKMPVLVFRDLDSEIDPTFFKSLEISVKVLGASGFTDLLTLKQQHGIRNADAELRHRILNLIGEG